MSRTPFFLDQSWFNWQSCNLIAILIQHGGTLWGMKTTLNWIGFLCMRVLCRSMLSLQSWSCKRLHCGGDSWRSSIPTNALNILDNNRSRVERLQNNTEWVGQFAPIADQVLAPYPGVLNGGKDIIIYLSVKQDRWYYRPGNGHGCN